MKRSPSQPGLARRAQVIAPYLASLYARYHRPGWIGLDPLHWARAYEDRADREIAAFLAASLAYGQVAQIDRSLADLFKRIGRSPAAFARNFSPKVSARALDGFYHRFNTSRDLCALFHLLGQMLRGWGSIEGFWAWAASGDGATPIREADGIAGRAGRFVDAALALDLEGFNVAPRRREGDSEKLQGAVRPRDSLLYLLPKADGGSACKRLNMFLRWVVRSDDGVDLGLWSVEKPADLEYPVDTHIHRLSRYLGATRRNAADAATRREITGFFRAIAPDDPVKFDFSLCRLGIVKTCPARNNLAMCEPCELRPVCLRHREMLRACRPPAAAVASHHDQPQRHREHRDVVREKA